MLQAPASESMQTADTARTCVKPKPEPATVEARLPSRSTVAHVSRNPSAAPLPLGNQATLLRLSRTAPHVQCKLEIGAVNDPLEAEADRVADHVMRMPDPHVLSNGNSSTLRRKCPCEESGAPCESCAQANGEKLQRKFAGNPRRAAAPAAVHEVLRSSGQPLDPAARAFFEPRFGRDLSSVRVHSDSKAAESAHAVNALAYTVGRHIVFAGGYARHGAGQRLLAHELAHVIQQNGDATPPFSPDASAPSSPAAPAGLLRFPSPGPISLQRQSPEDDQDAGTGGDRNTQLECVKRLGGCANTRPGGIPTPEEIADYNTRCRSETHYGGDDVTPSDDECHGNVAPAPPPAPADAYICGRALNYPALNLFFNHSYISAPPANYGIVAPLCTPTDGGWNNLILGTAAHKRDDSCDPGAETPECIPCNPKQGVTDVKQCLRDAYNAYNSPTMHKALGPNSNTFAYTLAKTCCAGITTSAPFSSGNTPGWGDPPASTRPATCPPGPPDCS